MRGNKLWKRALLLALCGMLIMPVGRLAGSGMVVEAAPEGNEADQEDNASKPKKVDDEDTTQVINPSDPAELQDKINAKKVIVDYYKIWKDKIKSAGKEAEAQDYMNRAVGDVANLNEIPAESSLGSQQTIFGVETITEVIKKEIDTYAVPAPEPTPDPEPEPDPTPSSSNSNIMVGGNWVTPVANAGQYVNVVLPVVNMGEDMVRDAVVTPAVSSNSGEWPFEIEQSSYTQTIADLPGTHDGGTDMDRRRELTWTWKTRKDAPSGYQKLTFQVAYKNSDGTFDSATLETYVKVVGTTGTSSDGTSSTPRVIVTGFSTNPEVVHAGSTFTLTLHMQNTSNATAVKNMLFDIQAASESTDTNYVAAAFLPTSGSSTVFVDRIPAGGTKDISMELEARSDLAQKPYVVNVTMDYEDENVNAYKNTANVSIPVRQEARVEISSIEVMPEAIEVGSESNVMFSIYNTGKTQLFNTSVKLEAESITGGESYLGNIAPGATGNVDVYVTGQMATMDDGLVKILITYEDEAGEATTIEKEMTLYVSEPFYDDSMIDDGMMWGEEEQKKCLPVWAIALIVIVVLAVGVIAIVLIRKRKRKKAAEAEVDLLEDELMEENSFSEEDEE